MASWSSSGHACVGADSGWLTVGVYRKRRGSPPAGSRPRGVLVGRPGLAGLGPLGSPARPGAPPLELEPGGGPAPGITACWIGGGRIRGRCGTRGMGPVRHAAWGRWRHAAWGRCWHAAWGRWRRAEAGGAGDARGPGRRQPRDGRSVPLSPVPCRLRDTPGEERRKRGDKPGKPICHFPADRTGRDRAGQGLWRTPRPGAATKAPRVTQATPVPRRRLKFFMPWPGWRQVALMGRDNQRLRILEEGFTGRCPPCLLGHRRVTRRSASPKLHKSLGHHVSQPARRTAREWARE